jgi:hypothetical protein
MNDQEWFELLYSGYCHINSSDFTQLLSTMRFRLLCLPNYLRNSIIIKPIMSMTNIYTLQKSTKKSFTKLIYDILPGEYPTNLIDSLVYHLFTKWQKGIAETTVYESPIIPRKLWKYYFNILNKHHRVLAEEYKRDSAKLLNILNEKDVMYNLSDIGGLCYLIDLYDKQNDTAISFNTLSQFVNAVNFTSNYTHLIQNKNESVFGKYQAVVEIGTFILSAFTLTGIIRYIKSNGRV